MQFPGIVITPSTVLATRARSTEFSKEVSPDEEYTGYTALHYAVLADSVPIINLLFDYGGLTVTIIHDCWTFTA